ncbi:MAG: s-methyl-5-thioribose-1-phosphate isomerase [Pleomorphochaeta sp.]
MKRLDDGMAFILKYKNIAWYENGKVRILDRRIYPMEVKFVECTTYSEVAQAITDMVTQSWGPYFAAGMGMALAAHQAKDLTETAFTQFMHDAGIALYTARPTTSAFMKEIVEKCEDAAIVAKLHGKSAVEAAFNTTVEYYDEIYTSCQIMGKYLVNNFPQKGSVMTQCWAETVVGMMLKSIREQNKDIKFYCPETRPYLQGGRLTASCIKDMGFDVTVITDNMPGYVLEKKKIDVFTSAADVICMDGHIVNKVGTFQIALACNYFDIPYYVTGKPNLAHPDRASIVIEERDPELVLHALDKKFTYEGVKGYYPAFDITPPSLCAGVITDRGQFSPDELRKYYE